MPLAGDASGGAEAPGRELVGGDERTAKRADELLGRLGGRGLCADHAKVLSRVWILMQVCTIAIVLAGFAVGAIGGDIGFGFLGVYIACLSLFMSVAGALMLRKYRSPAHHGLLLGLSFMMANVMLINAVVVGARRDCADGTNSAEMAVGAFSVFLFVLYSIFTVLLYVWREDIIVRDHEQLEGIELGADVEGGYDDESSHEADRNAEHEGQDLKIV